MTPCVSTKFCWGQRFNGPIRTYLSTTGLLGGKLPDETLPPSPGVRPDLSLLGTTAGPEGKVLKGLT